MTPNLGNLTRISNYIIFLYILTCSVLSEFRIDLLLEIFHMIKHKTVRPTFVINWKTMMICPDGLNCKYDLVHHDPNPNLILTCTCDR